MKMTTLFPQIKRVDEDETSKIIKNVLFNSQDKKLEQIFDEFMHLTHEISDVEVDDDEEEEEQENFSESGSEESEESEESDSSDASQSSDESESEEVRAQKREPTSWNLDEFIKIPTPVANLQHQPNNSTSTSATTTTTAATTTPSPPLPTQQPPSRPIAPKRQLTPPQPPVVKSELRPDNNHIVEIKERHHKVDNHRSEPKVKLKVEVENHHHNHHVASAATIPAPAPEIKELKLENNHVSPAAAAAAPTEIKAEKRPESYIVRIDLSKLKRIPGTKVPTPTIVSNSISTAKALKHEADAEKDRTKSAIKYLESAMYFVLHGYELEVNSKNTAYYTDVIPLFKHVMRQSLPNNLENPDNMTNLKIHALALKCLSLLYSRIYRSRQPELTETTKVIQSQANNSPLQTVDGLYGVKPQLFSAYKRQVQIYNNLRCANDNWHNVEHLCDQHPALRIFFSCIDQHCGPLSMVSPPAKLMEHVQCGLKLLKTS